MGKLKMTHNEYREFLQDNSAKIWKKDFNYSMSDYAKDSKSVEILPFNLKKFNLSKDIEKIVNDNFTHEYINEDGEPVIKGFVNSEDGWYNLINKLNIKHVINNSYNGYCYNDENNFYMDYCECDVYLKLFTNKEEYKKSLDKTIKWYEEN